MQFRRCHVTADFKFRSS